MTGKRKLLSRRRRALRRVLIAAAAFCLTSFAAPGKLLPTQAIRENEEHAGAGRTAVVCREKISALQINGLVYLTEGENVTMLSGTDLCLWGWKGMSGVALDCSEEQPAYCGAWTLSRQGAEVLYIFGRVDDPDIARVEVRGCYSFYDEASEPPARAERPLDLPPIGAADWLERDGRRYFLLKTDCPRGLGIGYVGDLALIAYDGDGRAVLRQEVEDCVETYLYD